MSSSKTLDNLVLAVECPDSFTEFATPSCGFVVPDYTTLAVVTGAGATPMTKKSLLPYLVHLKYELNYYTEQCIRNITRGDVSYTRPLSFIKLKIKMLLKKDLN